MTDVCMTVLPLQPAVEVIAFDDAVRVVALGIDVSSFDTLPCAPVDTTIVQLIPGTPGPAGAGFGTVAEFVAVTDGEQSIPFTGGQALLFCNGLVVRSTDYTITGAMIDTSPSFPVETGDVFTIIPY